MPRRYTIDPPARRHRTFGPLSTLIAVCAWLAATAVRPTPVAVMVEAPKQSRWARWGPTIVEGLVLAGLLLGLSEWRETQRAERADKRALQQTLYVADLKGIVMPGEDLSGLSFGGRDLTGADLTEADLTGANLSSADLTGAKLSEADLTGAKLSEADLTGADLLWADLGGADLGEADLTETDLGEADLGGANLSGANLSGANLGIAILDLKRSGGDPDQLSETLLNFVKWDPENPPTWPHGFDPPKNAWDPEENG